MIPGRSVNADLQKLLNSTAEFDEEDEDETGMEVGDKETRGDFYQMEFRQHKRDYYHHKLGYAQVQGHNITERRGSCLIQVGCYNVKYLGDPSSNERAGRRICASHPVEPALLLQRMCLMVLVLSSSLLSLDN